VICTHALRDGVPVRRKDSATEAATSRATSATNHRGREPALWPGCLARALLRRGRRKYFHLGVGTWARTIRLHTIRRSDIHWRDKTISIPWQSLDEPGVLDVVAQGLAQFIHGRVNAVFEVNEGIGGQSFCWISSRVTTSPAAQGARRESGRVVVAA
jgi:hypothetical protein